MAIENSAANADPMGVIGDRTVANKQQIYSILASVQKARTAITIKFEDNDRYYTSLILRTDLSEGYIIIDEIAPEDGHHLVLQHKPFSIRGSHNGISLFFRPNIISGSGIQDGIAFYQVPLPKEMLYQQRRSAFRAVVARALGVKASVTSKERGLTYEGRLHDISISGCRINFEGEVKPGFVRTEVFESCKIMLSDGSSIECPLTLKHATYERDWKETTCGFKFEGLDKYATKSIDRFVYFLQREARRLETK